LFCPKCKGEFRDGFVVCKECSEQLVPEMPEEPEPKFIEYEEIIATYNSGDIAYLKCILDSEGITYHMKGEHFMYVRPLADPVRLMVKKDQVDDAREIIKDLNLYYLGVNVGKS